MGTLKPIPKPPAEQALSKSIEGESLNAAVQAVWPTPAAE